MRVSIRIIEILTILTALPVFAAANQDSLPEKAKEPARSIPSLHYDFEKVPAGFESAYTNFQYLRTGREHDRIVTVFLNGDRNAPGDSRRDIWLWNYRTGDFQCYWNAGEGGYLTFRFGLQDQKPVAYSNGH